MLLSDISGAIGSFALVVPSIRDLALRAKREKVRGDSRSRMAALRAALARSVEEERSALSGYDVVAFAFGCLLLMASFVLKLFAL